MPDCRPCLEKRLVAKPALYVVNGVPLCEECKNNPEKRNKQIEAKKEVTKEKENMKMEGKINWEQIRKERESGTPVGQLAARLNVSSTLVYMNTKAGKKVTAPTMKRAQRQARKAVRAIRESSRDYSISDIIAQLEQRRDKLAAAIESLKEAEK